MMLVARSALFAVLVTAAMAAGSAGAATVVQASSFDIVNSYLFHPTAPSAGNFAYSTSHPDVTPRTFAGFDTSLGTLTGARLSVVATEDFRAGASVFGSPSDARVLLLPTGGYRTQVLLGAANLNAYSFNFFGSQRCDTTRSDACVTVQSNHRDVDLDHPFLDLSPFLLGAPVTFDLASGVNDFGTIIIGAGTPPLMTAAGALDWIGVATLTYTYDAVVVGPPGVPEPQTWALMLIGFGGLGAVLRRSSLREHPSA